MTTNHQKHTLSEAMNLLTVTEARAIQSHFGAEIGNGLDGIALSAGIVWAWERRGFLAHQGGPDGTKMPSWAEIEDWPLTTINDYFIPEPDADVIAGEPDSDQGKGLSSVAA